MNEPILTIVVPCYNEEAFYQIPLPSYIDLLEQLIMKDIFPTKVKYFLSMMEARIKHGDHL